MSAIGYRDARPEDIPALAGVFLEAVADMFDRHGVATPIPPRAAVERGYLHVLETGIFQVAEIEGEIVGIAGAVVRDRLWFLSAFWVLPARQREGIGMPLLRRVHREGAARGAERFFTWSSIDPSAMAAYLKLGMWPGGPILQFEGIPKSLPEAASDTTTVPLETSVAQALDRQVRGAGRMVDHRFWEEGGLMGRAVVRGGEEIGYFRHRLGTVGPVAWRAPADGPAVLALALREAAGAGGEVRLAVPGCNRAAQTLAMAAGLKRVAHAQFMTSAPFGALEQYLPSGPSLF